MSTQTGRNVRVEIAATYATAVALTAVTAANPAVATSTAAHTLADGVIGYMDAVTGMEEIDGVAFSVSAPATPAFTLEEYDASANGTFTAGTFVPVATWSLLSPATSVEISEASPELIDTTRLIDRIKQQEVGNLNAQTVTVGGFSDAQNAAVKLVRAAGLVGAYIVFRLTFSNGERRIFRGQASLPGESLSVGQKATGSMTFTVKGAVGFLPA